MSPSTRRTDDAPGRRRVSRGTLSRQHIVDATVQLVRDQPDEPVTMERVAAVLGTRPMSLYTHVRNRDELMGLAAEQVLREWEASVPPDAPWDEQLGAWCRSLRAHVREYPPLMLEMTGQGTFPPALLQAVAVLAGILRRAGLEGSALAAAVRWVPQNVLGAVVLELTRPAGLETPRHEAAAIFGSLGSLSAEDRAQYDDVLEHFASPALPDLFEYSVDRLADGIRAAAQAAAAGAPPGHRAGPDEGDT